MFTGNAGDLDIFKGGLRKSLLTKLSDNEKQVKEKFVVSFLEGLRERPEAISVFLQAAEQRGVYKRKKMPLYGQKYYWTYMHKHLKPSGRV